MTVNPDYQQTTPRTDRTRTILRVVKTEDGCSTVIVGGGDVGYCFTVVCNGLQGILRSSESMGVTLSDKISQKNFS